jgi:hypothetical protein
VLPNPGRYDYKIILYIQVKSFLNKGHKEIFIFDILPAVDCDSFTVHSLDHWLGMEIRAELDQLARGQLLQQTLDH